MSKKFYTLLSVVLLASMLLAACAPAATPAPTTAPAAPTMAPEPTMAPTEAPKPTAVPPTEAPKPTEPAAAAKMKVCEVTDTGGIDDKSFNATAWKGAEDAAKQLQNVEAKYLESQQQTDYEKNINAFIDEKCDLIVTVGFLLGDATAAAGKANPTQKFAIVDYAYDPTIDNVLGLVFNTDEAAFMAGYVAAANTKTGKIGTFGGINIPTVSIFMTGYYYGAQYYNEKHGTKVEVLGWDPAKPDQGLFTGNFESTDDGKRMGETLMDEGADIIMPVAGPVGLGTAAAVKERGNAWIVGVDTDWTVSAPDYKDIVLTSVIKNMDVSVLLASKAVQDGTFKGGVLVGTLENGGVGLPSTTMMDDALKAEIDQIKADIIAGKIKASGM